MLEVKKVNLAYGQMQVLKEVSLHVRDREIVSLIGANSAGKSSLLNAVSGLVPLAGGEILFEGKPIHTLPSHGIIELGIIQVPEGRRIFPWMSVRENLLMGSYSRRARPGSERTLRRVFELFPRLAERSGQLGESMSGGEQQMLAIGRALMANPEIILMDEPSEGLAPVVIRQIGEIMRNIRGQGHSILLVEQNFKLAMTVADFVYIIATGRIVYQGVPAELEGQREILDRHLGI